MFLLIGPVISVTRKSDPGFCKKWLINANGETRKWLHYDSVKNLMFCLYCIDHGADKNASYVKGPSAFKKTSVVAHELTVAHILAKNQVEGLYTESVSTHTECILTIFRDCYYMYGFV